MSLAGCTSSPFGGFLESPLHVRDDAQESSVILQAGTSIWKIRAGKVVWRVTIAGATDLSLTGLGATREYVYCAAWIGGVWTIVQLAQADGSLVRTNALGCATACPNSYGQILAIGFDATNARYVLDETLVVQASGTGAGWLQARFSSTMVLREQSNGYWAAGQDDDNAAMQWFLIGPSLGYTWSNLGGPGYPYDSRGTVGPISSGPPGTVVCYARSTSARVGELCENVWSQRIGGWTTWNPILHGAAQALVIGPSGISVYQLSPSYPLTGTLSAGTLYPEGAAPLVLSVVEDFGGELVTLGTDGGSPWICRTTGSGVRYWKMDGADLAGLSLTWNVRMILACCGLGESYPGIWGPSAWQA